MGSKMDHFWSKSGLRRGGRSGGAFLVVRGAIWGPFWVLFGSFSGSVFGVLFGGRLGGLLVASALDEGRIRGGSGEDQGRVSIRMPARDGSWGPLKDQRYLVNGPRLRI